MVTDYRMPYTERPPHRRAAPQTPKTMIPHFKKPALAAPALTALAALSAPVMAQGTPPTMSSTVIRVNPQQERGAISPGIYGSNHRYANNGIGMWDPINKRSLPAFDANHRRAGLKFIRYPGGTVGNTFEWKKSIGPVEARPTIQPFSGGGTPTGLFGAPNVATFGLDEGMRWAKNNGVEIIYMYGLAFGTPQDAADLIEYLNMPVGKNPTGGIDWAAVRAANGHPAPYNIRHFELANEADGPSQRYWWPHIDSDETRAKKQLSFNPQRDSYAPEFLLGGMARFEKQLLGTRDARGGTDFRDAQAISNGQPNQIKAFRYSPIEPNSDEVFVGDEKWTRVPNIKTARGKVYQVDGMTGTVLFGNGVNGDLPPQGAAISANYRSRRHGFVDVYKAMKAVDPNIKIYAGYESHNIIDTMGDKHEYDGMVIHPYTNQWNVPKAATVEEWHHNLMLSGVRLGREVEEYQEHIDKTVAPARKGQVRVIATEFGALSQDLVSPKGTTDGSWRFLNIGLYTAQQLMWYMRAHTPHADRHATTVGVFGGAPDFEYTPTAQVYEMFTRHFGDRLIGVQTQNVPIRATENMLIVGAGSRGSIKKANAPDLPAHATPVSLPKLDVEASRDAAGNVYVVVLNQDASDAVAANLEIAGLSGNGQAEIRTLTGPTLTAFNTKENPNAVQIAAATRPFSAGAFRHTFPAYSLTSIKFPAGAVRVAR